MKIKRFVAKDMRSALNQVKIELGVDAVIMSNTKTSDGIEIVAAVDNAPKQEAPAPEQEKTLKVSAEKKSSLINKIKAYDKSNAMDSLSKEMNSEARSVEDIQVSDSLQSLLMRQQEVKARQSSPKSHAPATKIRTREVSSDNTDLDWSPEDNFHSQPSGFAKQTGQSELAQMQAEMAEMKKMMQFQMAGLMWQELARKEPVRAYLVDRLAKMGIANEVADQVASFVPEGVDQNEAWDSALDLLAGQINVTNNDIMRRGGIVALVGPTGVGKTTTVAKLAAHFARKHGSDSVALVTTDTYRIGASEQLQTYAKIIGCPCKVVSQEEELAEILYQLRNRKLILIDTAGVGQRDIRLAQQLESLMASSKAKIRSYLVMQATAQRRVLNETIEQFKKVSLNGCIFTKIDESISLGEIISVAIQNGLPIGYLTDGQRVPEDIKSASARYLVEKATELMDERDFSLPYWFTDNAKQPIYK